MPVTTATIKKLWGRFDLKLRFQPDVNVLIGINGTGKSTVINLINAVLTCDLSTLSSTQFDSASVCVDGDAGRYEISVCNLPDAPWQAAQYTINDERYTVMRDRPPHLFRSGLVHSRAFRSAVPRPTAKAQNTAEDAVSPESLKPKLSGIIQVDWLSVHRAAAREIARAEAEARTPAVDIKLGHLREAFKSYQLELENAEAKVSKEFQQRVFRLMLHDPELDGVAEQDLPKLQADLPTLGQRLEKAFEALGTDPKAFNADLTRHLDKLAESIDTWAQVYAGGKNLELRALLTVGLVKRSRRMLDFFDQAEEEKLSIFASQRLFLELVESFLVNKHIDLDASGDIRVLLDLPKRPRRKPTSIHLDVTSLSSGEKQLLILLLEPLLQRKRPCLYMADEPEISLHVAWQERIISSLRSLNPNAQVIVATHSPDIVAEFGDRTIDMGELLYG